MSDRPTLQNDLLAAEIRGALIAIQSRQPSSSDLDAIAAEEDCRARTLCQEDICPDS